MRALPTPLTFCGEREKGDRRWESLGLEREEQVEGQSRVVWSPVQFVLGVRRTTTGAARSMNINTAFFWNRDVSFDLLLNLHF